jgi:beta-N-acetylhexosaminidase
VLGCAAVPAVASAAPAAPSSHGHGPKHIPRGWIISKIRHMSLEEKVGQLFVTYAYGESADTTNAADVAANAAAYGVDTPAEVVQKYHLGGVIYFNWTDSANNPTQIAHLSNGIQRAAVQSGAHVPLLISTDQEGGIVVRVNAPATQFPGNMAIGATRSAQDAYTAAHITGEELRAIGVNEDFAPVSDVNVEPKNPVIGVRSFGSDPALVSQLAGSEVDGYQDANVAATAKHFPGHGDTKDDSHTGLPVIHHTLAQWKAIDLPPFQADIRHGIDAIMTAHIVVPALDPSGDPATLSKPIMTGILRNQLHYDGVVITDSLGMQGVRDKYGDNRVPVLALQAGVDMLLMPPNMDLAYNSVLNAVRDGELSQQRIDQSLYRILRLKYERGVFAHPFVDESRVDDIVGTPAHLAAAQQITDRSVTLVKNDTGSLPVAAGTHTLVTGWGVSTTSTLAADLTAHGVPADSFWTGSPDASAIQEAVAKAEQHELTVVLTNKAWADQTQVDLVNALLATGKPVVVVAVRDPYDIAYFPDAPAYLATYSYTGVGLESLARVLSGAVNPSGKLPVSIPTPDESRTLYPFGYGLSYGS